MKKSWVDYIVILFSCQDAGSINLYLSKTYDRCKINSISPFFSDIISLNDWQIESNQCYSSGMFVYNWVEIEYLQMSYINSLNQLKSAHPSMSTLYLSVNANNHVKLLYFIQVVFIIYCKWASFLWIYQNFHRSTYIFPAHLPHHICGFLFICTHSIVSISTCYQWLWS